MPFWPALKNHTYYAIKTRSVDWWLELASWLLESPDCRLESPDCRLELSDCRLESADWQLESASYWNGPVAQSIGHTYTIISTRISTRISRHQPILFLAPITSNLPTGYGPWKRCSWDIWLPGGTFGMAQQWPFLAYTFFGKCQSDVTPRCSHLSVSTLTNGSIHHGASTTSASPLQIRFPILLPFSSCRQALVCDPLAFRIDNTRAGPWISRKWQWLIKGRQGRIQGGGGPGGKDPPPPFWGTPKLHKEGKKRRACAHENATF